MFFVVSSNNRHAVRRLLTSAGVPSKDVRSLANGKLGAMLHSAVAEGKIPKDKADQAIKEDASKMLVGKALDEQQEAETAAEQTVTAEDASSLNNEELATKADELAEAIRKAMQSKPSLDVDKVTALIKALVPPMIDKIAGISRPVEIKHEPDGKLVKIELAHSALPDILKTVNTRISGRRLHVWLVGPSGSGKSTIAAQAATALRLPYYSTGAVQSKYDLIGHGGVDGKNESTLYTPFRRAFETGGVFAFDDADASNANAFAALNEALANGVFAFPDKMVTQHMDFVCIASANTWGSGATADYVGRNKIDAATLTRFVRFEIPYDEALERALVGDEGKAWAEYVQKVRANVYKQGLKVLITPRHTLQGAALLKAGMLQSLVECVTIFAGLDAQTIAKVK